MSISRIIFTCLSVIFAASCTYQGNVEDPVNRKFTWFSYVNGDDIRKVCADLGADRYRFVYNGIYQRQTRTYDVFFHARKIKMTVSGESNLANFNADDLMAAWRANVNELEVSDKLLNLLKKSLNASAALQPAPTGLRLYSDKFFWTVAACVDGKFHFNAYLWPSARWDQMVFADILKTLDVSGIPFEEPKAYTPIEIWGSLQEAAPFLMEVGGNGLVGFE